MPLSTRVIQKGAFCLCKDLGKVSLNEGLESIGIECFVETGIESVVLPTSVKKVGARAFYDCK